MMQQQEGGSIGYRLAEALNSTLQRSCSGYETSCLLSKATILDPHFKTLTFISLQKADEAVKSVSSGGAMLVLEGPAQALPPTTSASSTSNEIWQDFDTRKHVDHRVYTVMLPLAETCAHKTQHKLLPQGSHSMHPEILQAKERNLQYSGLMDPQPANITAPQTMLISAIHSEETEGHHTDFIKEFGGFLSDTSWQYRWNKDSYYYTDSYQQKYTISSVSESDAALPRATVRVTPDTSVFTGETVTLKCEIEKLYTSLHWRYLWYKDRREVLNSERYTVNTNTLTISSVTQSDQNQFWCETEIHGRPQTSSSSYIYLTVKGSKPKAELRSDTEGSVLTGNTVTLKCLMNQFTGWKFYWYKHTQNTEKTTTDENYYTIPTVTVSDGGLYWCRAGRGNPVYYTDYSDVLWINVTDDLLTPPQANNTKYSKTPIFIKYVTSLIKIKINFSKCTARPSNSDTVILRDLETMMR
ncbi:putative sialoadhesin-like, partial [Triplophysa rosa]